MVALPSFAAGSSNGSRRSSSKNGKQKQLNGSSNGSSASNNTKSFLLARGWTSRLALPSILPPLRADEMDKDLRHMQVYGSAVESYQQQHYMQMNRLSDNGGMSAHAAASTVVPSLALPVRIDPEEEKRLFNLRKKIAAAELLREQLEQEWVSNQAHYVHVAAKLRQTQSHRKETAQFLQKAVQRRGAVTAHARLRLQMTRDVLNALRYRMNKLQSAAGTNTPGVSLPPSDNKPVELNTTVPAVGAASNEPVSEAAPKAESEDSGTKMEIDQNASVTGGSDDDQLTAMWITAEEDYKKSCSQMLGLNEKSKKKSDKMGLMPWVGSKLPTTPYDVPLLVSVLSTIPDKTVAYGPDPLNMVWMPNNLPEGLDDEVDENEDTAKGDDENDDWLMNDEAADTKVLKARVARLEKELRLERSLNTEWSAKIAASRKANDEWVAMMSLVRQETEALLHRHNILLESDLALTASEQLHEQEMQEKAENAAKQVDPEGQNEDAGADDTPKEVSTSSNSIPLKNEETSNIDEAANYGDDEGSGEPEEDEKDEWAAGSTNETAGANKEGPSSEDATENGNKRPSDGGDEEGSNDAKRRRMDL